MEMGWIDDFFLFSWRKLRINDMKNPDEYNSSKNDSNNKIKVEKIITPCLLRIEYKSWR